MAEVSETSSRTRRPRSRSARRRPGPLRPSRALTPAADLNHLRNEAKRIAESAPGQAVHKSGTRAGPRPGPPSGTTWGCRPAPDGLARTGGPALPRANRLRNPRASRGRRANGRTSPRRRAASPCRSPRTPPEGDDKLEGRPGADLVTEGAMPRRPVTLCPSAASLEHAGGSRTTLGGMNQGRFGRAPTRMVPGGAKPPEGSGGSPLRRARWGRPRLAPRRATDIRKTWDVSGADSWCARRSRRSAGRPLARRGRPGTVRRSVRDDITQVEPVRLQRLPGHGAVHVRPRRGVIIGLVAEPDTLSEFYYIDDADNASIELRQILRSALRSATHNTGRAVPVPDHPVCGPPLRTANVIGSPWSGPRPRPRRPPPALDEGQAGRPGHRPRHERLVVATTLALVGGAPRRGRRRALGQGAPNVAGRFLYLIGTASLLIFTLAVYHFGPNAPRRRVLQTCPARWSAWACGSGSRACSRSTSRTSTPTRPSTGRSPARHLPHLPVPEPAWPCSSAPRSTSSARPARAPQAGRAREGER